MVILETEKHIPVIPHPPEKLASLSQDYIGRLIIWAELQ